jgi:ribonucleoside-diphosphate reductase alpha chain
MATLPHRRVQDVFAATRFTDPLAVEAWDRWFRWRERSALRDVTIDATWWRVAEAIAAVERMQAPQWAHRFVDAFSRWRLLPDERLLTAAGTNTQLDGVDAPAAVLNVAAFVTPPLAGRAMFDKARFAEAAGLAVRLLDNALEAYGTRSNPPRLRIGVIGMADSLHLLGMPYGSAEARAHAGSVALALAEGCLRSTIDLAAERGALDAPAGRDELAARWRSRGIPRWLIEQGIRRGVRHAALTAIEPHPRLASLANNVTDAIDPPPGSVRMGLEGSADTLGAAQREMRAAMQPWIDAPIDYPHVATPEAAADPSRTIDAPRARLHGAKDRRP